MKTRLIGSAVAAVIVFATGCSTDGPPTAPTLALNAQTEATVLVGAFIMIEFQYPSAPGVWHYAPRLTLVGAKNGRASSVMQISFEIPGLGRIPPCNTHLALEEGQQMDLFTELYGDYTFTIHGVARASADTAVAVLTLKNLSGSESTVRVSGKIVPGELPTTYTGGSPNFRCS